MHKRSIFYSFDPANSGNMQEKPWNDYPGFVRRQFGRRVQKISVNTGLGCPNLDGKISNHGCTYCNNSSFSPFYCRADKSVSQQLKEGIDFFSKKYKAQKYLAYFQSFTNTYTGYEHFRSLTEEALSVDGICGLVIATRPDSITDEQISLLDDLAKEMYVSLEFGVESCIDRSLQRIHRGHDFACTQAAFTKCRPKAFRTGAHLILGLPGESKEDMLKQADCINRLKPDSLKLHQLQVLKDTALAEEFKQVPDDFVKFSAESYIRLVAAFLEKLNPEIVVERFTSESPRELVISPDWKGMKNFEFVDQLKKYMLTSGIWQGKAYEQHADY